MGDVSLRWGLPSFRRCCDTRRDCHDTHDSRRDANSRSEKYDFISLWGMFPFARDFPHPAVACGFQKWFAELHLLARLMTCSNAVCVARHDAKKCHFWPFLWAYKNGTSQPLTRRRTPSRRRRRRAPRSTHARVAADRLKTWPRARQDAAGRAWEMLGKTALPRNAVLGSSPHALTHGPAGSATVGGAPPRS